jgi:hypothetical protein
MSKKATNLKREYQAAQEKWTEAILATNAAEMAFLKAKGAEARAKKRFVRLREKLNLPVTETQRALVKFNRFSRTPEMGN